MVDLGTVLTNDSTYVKTSGNQTIGGNKTFSSPISLNNKANIQLNGDYAALDKSPTDTDISKKIATTEWVRKVIQVDDSTITTQYVSSKGNDANDGKSVTKAKGTV